MAQKRHASANVNSALRSSYLRARSPADRQKLFQSRGNFSAAAGGSASPHKRRPRCGRPASGRRVSPHLGEPAAARFPSRPSGRQHLFAPGCCSTNLQPERPGVALPDGDDQLSAVNGEWPCSSSTADSRHFRYRAVGDGSHGTALDCGWEWDRSAVDEAALLVCCSDEARLLRLRTSPAFRFSRPNARVVKRSRYDRQRCADGRQRHRPRHRSSALGRRARLLQ
jgi:hypothetical protein